ncbi:deaminase domain-containing protein [Trichormus sp. NMC-1]|uniref:deaminase domain-containing protein n=1 Tax=Trichormus sp. NMC-1 TaxID=1853259 RepID=UPI0008DBFC99|nr:deaminase domain-containing protein [Trichormus sp. NMC-1]
MTNTQDNNGDENPIKKRLRESAAKIREILLSNKPISTQPFPKVKNNVAVAEVQIGDVIFHLEATSNKKSPIPRPKPRSEGGKFQPGLDSYSGRIMDTDAEYKLLSKIADILEIDYNLQIEGYLYLYTEQHPCQSCQDVKQQFEEKFPNMKVEIFWDYPYPP